MRVRGGRTIPAVVAGVVASFVGYASSASVVLAGLLHVGATPRDAASGLLALSVLMGCTGIALSFRLRQPISAAWSTSGAALLAVTARPPGGFSTAVEAFVIAGLLAVATGAFPPFARAVALVPAPLGAAMLAGVLLPLCARVAVGIVDLPAVVAPCAAVWLLLMRIARTWAVPGAVAAAAIAVAVAGAHGPGAGGVSLVPHPMLHVPHGSIVAAIAIAVPLYLVTMASQNLPGLAVLRINGFDPPVRPLLVATGTASVVAAPLGGHGINLAALTAALVAGPEAHPDPRRRWVAAAAGGVAFVGLGLAAGTVIALAGFAPPLVVEAIAGLALVGALGGSLASATGDDRLRDAAVVTFAVTASAIRVVGISAPMWGLVAGIATAAASGSRRCRAIPWPVKERKCRPCRCAGGSGSTPSQRRCRRREIRGR
ncbi:MAG: benzoate rane transport protein [Frankiaceae bacterium]|nr:benzoate rane transport protein [Frankiaceae bacterium]